MADGSTPNFNLTLPQGNRRNWTDLMNGNLRTIDALIATYVSVTNLRGLWVNSIEYDVGDNVIDETSGVVYTSQVEHISSAAPTTFLEERTANPTYWLTFATAARNRGTWTTATAYAVNDFVLADGTKYAMCIEAHTSGANFTTDEAAGKWEVMIDLSTVGSLVLPVLSGPADADKIVMTDPAGVSYVINSATALLTILLAAQGSTGSGGFALETSPVLAGNPTAPTASAEDNDVSIATTQYADRAVRNLVIRRQTFSTPGAFTYTPDDKLIYAHAEGVGGGGGGAGIGNSAGGTGTIAGGGGGAGGYSSVVLSAAQVSPSVAGTIGAAGTNGAAGANNGGAGGTTSLGALRVANGGSGGTSAGSLAGGLGGIIAGAVGDITSPGMPGGTGANANGSVSLSNGSGYGGSGKFGAGGLSRYSNGAGFAGVGFGAGGSGGASQNASGAAAGGAGTGGYIVITEYCYG